MSFKEINISKTRALIKMHVGRTLKGFCKKENVVQHVEWYNAFTKSMHILHKPLIQAKLFVFPKH